MKKAIGILTSLLLLLVCLPAAAQVPDTTSRQKPVLPTGPPMPEPQQNKNQRPQPRPVEKPVVVQEPVVQAAEVQDEERKAFIDRLYFGGSFGLQFGTYTNISLFPILGYKVTDKLSVGPGIVYHFISFRGESLQNYGGRLFAQHELLNGVIGDGALLVHGEVEVLSYENYWNAYSIEATRRTVTTPLAGVGYRQSAGRVSFDLLLLYNFNEVDSPYANPVIRAGLNIPFRR